MTSPGTTSDRHNLPVPGDGQDEPSDDLTQALNISDPDAVNWGDIIQTLLLSDKYIDGRLVGSGTLSGRPSAGSTAPKFYVVTDGGDSADQPYLTYNDDTTWRLATTWAERNSITDADSPYTASAGETVWADASSAAVTVSLPAPSDSLPVRVVVIDATNDVTISRNGSEQIDGDAADLVIEAELAVTLQSDGTNWRALAETDALVAQGTVTLSSGTATVSTGLGAGSHVTVYLDSSGGGANSADVKATARSFWDDSASEHKLELVENGTSVDTPDIGYKVVTR